MAVDPATDAFLLFGFPSTLRAMKSKRFAAGIDYDSRPKMFADEPGALGHERLALRTTSNQIFLIPTALVDPVGFGTGAHSDAVTDAFAIAPYIPTFVKSGSSANDLVIDQSTQLIYASVRSAQGATATASQRSSGEATPSARRCSSAANPISWRYPVTEPRFTSPSMGPRRFAASTFRP